jgi:hypothetical protein
MSSAPPRGPTPPAETNRPDPPGKLMMSSVVSHEKLLEMIKERNPLVARALAARARSGAR